MAHEFGPYLPDARTRTLVALAKIWRVALGLVDPETMPSIQLAMLSVKAEIEDEIAKSSQSYARSYPMDEKHKPLD